MMLGGSRRGVVPIAEGARAIYDAAMTGTLIERAAVVALLLHGRERGLGSWTALAGELLDNGSALELLRRPAGQQDLFVADADTQLAEAVDLLGRWTATGIDVHSVLDDGYPALLRDI